MASLPDGGIVLGLEPLNSVGGRDLVRVTDARLAASALGNTETRAGPNQHHQQSSNTHFHLVGLWKRT